MSLTFFCDCCLTDMWDHKRTGSCGVFQRVLHTILSCGSESMFWARAFHFLPFFGQEFAEAAVGLGGFCTHCRFPARRRRSVRAWNWDQNPEDLNATWLPLRTLTTGTHCQWRITQPVEEQKPVPRQTGNRNTSPIIQLALGVSWSVRSCAERCNRTACIQEGKLHWPTENLTAK